MNRIVRFVSVSAVFAALVIFTLLSCTTYDMEAPDEFAVIRDSDAFRAISPEGLKMRLRFEKNEPKQDLEFWSAALQNHLQREGYTPLGGPAFFEAGDREGIIFEWGAPLGGEDYIYLTAIVPADRTICIVEVAGKHSLYSKYKDSIEKSLETLTIR